MASKYTEQFYIKDSTPEGERLLNGREDLQNAFRLYIDAPEAHKARVPGVRLLGAGRYSFTFALNESIAIKISSPTTGQDAFDRKEALKPEDLGEQFAVLAAFKKHHRLARNNIHVPEQFLVAHTPNDTFLLVQEYMRGWEPVESRTAEVYDGRFEDQEAHDEVAAWTAEMRARVVDSLQEFALADRINDVGLKRPYGIHSGNLLVPNDVPLNGKTPLTIIDQPKI